MNLQALDRIQKEFSFTLHGLYETVLAIAERVTRKVHVLRLQWKAAALFAQMDAVTGTLGRTIADTVSRTATHVPPEESARSLDVALLTTQARLHELRRNLAGFDTEIRLLKLETIHEDLLSVQRDLTLRSASLERVVIPRGAAVIGQPLAAIATPPSVHVAAIFRGPYLLAPRHAAIIRQDDILLVMGPQADLATLATRLTTRRLSHS